MALTIPMGVAMLGRAALAAVLLTAGVAKLINRPGTRRALLDFGFPSFLASPLSIGVPAAELIVSVALLPAASARAGAVAASVLLAAFSMIAATAIARGRRVECRCFGPLTSGIVSWRTLARNAVLAAVALTVLLADRGQSPPSALSLAAGVPVAELVAWAVGLAAGVLIGLGTWGFVHLLRAHGRLLLRLEALEQRLVGSGIGHGLESSSEYAGGIPLGTRVPPMTAEDIEGRPVNWGDLLSPPRSVVLFFTSPQCSACRNLRPEIATWQERLAGRFRFVLASDGTPEEVRREAADFALTDILIDRDLRFFRAFEANRTPSAVLVREDGTVGSYVASGQDAISALLARIATESESESREEAAPPGTRVPTVSLRRLEGGRATLAELIRKPALVACNI